MPWRNNIIACGDKQIVQLKIKAGIKERKTYSLPQSSKMKA